MQELSPITDFGKEIKHRLIDLNRRPKWLVEEVKNKTGLYFDSSYLYKIQTGEHKTPKIVNAICEILSIENPYSKEASK